MNVRAHRRVGAVVVSAGIAVGGCVLTTAPAQADSNVGPLKQYWCPAEFVLTCDFWHTELWQTPIMQSPLWKTPGLRVPWQSDDYDNNN